MGIQTALEQAAELIIKAGAGMGIDSGLLDFRGKVGFWRAYPALRQAGLDFHSITSPAKASGPNPNWPEASTATAWRSTAAPSRTAASHC
jgi:NAD-dependent SIR2 family protein deacetylase